MPKRCRTTSLGRFPSRPFCSPIVVETGGGCLNRCIVSKKKCKYRENWNEKEKGTYYMPKRHHTTSLGHYLSVVPLVPPVVSCCCHAFGLHRWNMVDVRKQEGHLKKKKLAMKEMKMRKVKLTKGPSLGISSLSYSVDRKKVSKEKNETIKKHAIGPQARFHHHPILFIVDVIPHLARSLCRSCWWWFIVRLVTWQW